MVNFQKMREKLKILKKSKFQKNLKNETFWEFFKQCATIKLFWEQFKIIFLGRAGNINEVGNYRVYPQIWRKNETD